MRIPILQIRNPIPRIGNHTGHHSTSTTLCTGSFFGLPPLAAKEREAWGTPANLSGVGFSEGGHRVRKDGARLGGKGCQSLRQGALVERHLSPLGHLSPLSPLSPCSKNLLVKAPPNPRQGSAPLDPFPKTYPCKHHPAPTEAVRIWLGRRGG